MSAVRIWDRFKNLLDVNWASISDGQFLKRSGTTIIGETSMIVGNTTATGYAAGTVVVPRYVAHPDKVIASPNAFDDHFDGSSLNVKWTVTGADSLRIASVGGSHLLLSTQSAATDGASYTIVAREALPNANNFMVSFKMKHQMIAHSPSGSSGTLFFDLFNLASNYGVRVAIGVSHVSGVGGLYSLSNQLGANFGFTHSNFYGVIPAEYFRFTWNRATLWVKTQFSLDGVLWWEMPFPLESVSTGLGEGNLPDAFAAGCYSINYGMASVSLDWVKFVNF